MTVPFVGNATEIHFEAKVFAVAKTFASKTVKTGWCYKLMGMLRETFASKARLYDQEIDRWMPFQKVKSILLERTERQRLGLLSQDSVRLVYT